MLKSEELKNTSGTILHHTRTFRAAVPGGWLVYLQEMSGDNLEISSVALTFVPGKHADKWDVPVGRPTIPVPRTSFKQKAPPTRVKR